MLLLASLFLSANPVSQVPRIIVDTDFRSDVDDVGALTVLNALADLGECELVGVVASQTGPQIVGAINAVNTWYGRGDVPVGLSTVDDQRFVDHYAPVIGDPAQYPSTQANPTAPDSTMLYRRLLHESPDGSVRIAVIGGLTCLRLLWDSPADPEGDGSIGRTGRELVGSKVAALYLMAGNFEDASHTEHNVMLDLGSAQRIVTEWPTPVVFSGFEIGHKVNTGGKMTDPEHNPATKAYELFPAGGIGVIAESASFDQTLVYCAVRGVMAGATPLWGLSEPGRVTFPEGRTVFEADPNGTHRYMTLHASFDEVATVIEGLMTQAPKHGER